MPPRIERFLDMDKIAAKVSGNNGGNRAMKVDRRPRRDAHGEMRCVGQSDDGQWVLVRRPRALTVAKRTSEWLALPLMEAGDVAGA